MLDDACEYLREADSHGQAAVQCIGVPVILLRTRIMRGRLGERPRSKWRVSSEGRGLFAALKVGAASQGRLADVPGDPQQRAVPVELAAIRVSRSSGSGSLAASVGMSAVRNAVLKPDRRQVFDAPVRVGDAAQAFEQASGSGRSHHRASMATRDPLTACLPGRGRAGPELGQADERVKVLRGVSGVER